MLAAAKEQEKVLYLPKHSIEKSYHTKHKIDIWIIKLNTKFDYDSFQEIKARVEGFGGYYSKYSRGFIFEEDPSSFIALTDEFLNSKTDKETLKRKRTIAKYEYRLERLLNSQGGNEPWNDSKPFNEKIMKRANDNFMFRVKGKDWNKEFNQAVNEAQIEIEEVINRTDDEAIIIRLEYELERFKKDLYNNYKADIQNDASHPSFVVTGRSNYNWKKRDKQTNRKGTLIKGLKAIYDRFNKAISTANYHINRAEKRKYKAKMKKIYKNTEVNLKFSRVKVKINAGSSYIDGTAHRVETEAGKFTVVNNWGKFRLYKGYPEKIEMHSDIKEFNRLKDAKAYIQHLHNNKI